MWRYFRTYKNDSTLLRTTVALAFLIDLASSVAVDSCVYLVRGCLALGREEARKRGRRGLTLPHIYSTPSPTGGT